ncbi:MAG: TetR/AcrR family transcriptional regulator [Paracoccus sp. (in: a-proteobacteria)]|uniref:TetR/AcrR family transcriptional regulator n=1 Tax=Paracoccus sp. TaxID=267 RepID=UPI0039E36072
MGRKRSIDRDGLMQAVETVARRVGVSGLSLDAVAKEAGVSKSSVVYDCEGKAGLLAAFVRHQIAQFRKAHGEAYARHRDIATPNPWLHAMLDEFRIAPSDDDISITMLISASMGENAECRDVMRKALVQDIETVVAQAAEPCKMLRTLLTLQGMLFLECFGFHRFDEVTRNEILDDLMVLVDSDKGAAIP